MHDFDARDDFDPHQPQGAGTASEDLVNTPAAAPADTMHALQLVDVIDLKWLMAGMGHRLHVERLLADNGYARQCLALAASAPGAEVRAAAAKVCRQLGFDEPAPDQAC